jgi:hypothetical protein
MTFPVLVTNEYALHYDGRYTVKTEVLVEEDDSTYVLPLMYDDELPTFETLHTDAHDFFTGIGMTPYSFRTLLFSEWGI